MINRAFYTNAVSQLDAIELRVLVPSKDFRRSKRFYQDLGFTLTWCEEGSAYLRFRTCSFTLRDFYQKELAEHLTMQLLVPDVNIWHKTVSRRDIVGNYGVEMSPMVQQPWGMREFTLTDPSGVLWRIAQNIDSPLPKR